MAGRKMRWLPVYILSLLAALQPGFIGTSEAGRGRSNNNGGSPGNVATSTAEIDGALGGTVKCGRWSVVVPAGAFEGVGTVSIAVPDRNGLACDLDIKPGSLNKFLLPVSLVVSTAGLDVDPTTLTIYYYDPATGKWFDQQATGDSGKQTVTASLLHFSFYALGGKAGW